MKREIKFRAWDAITKKMWYPSAVAADGRNIALINAFGVETSDLQKDVIMQFTGLKDSKKVEIYEGDIVRYGDNTKSGIVEKLIIVKDIRFLPDFSCSKWEKVIGNIYENHETKDQEKIKGILFDLVNEIVALKEKECQNSGWNWQDEIKPKIDWLFEENEK